MPSPFPGMDPYLEAPTWWRDLHNRMMTYIADALNAVLPAGYYAQMDERLYISEVDRRIFPDVAVLAKTRQPAGTPSGAAVADRTAAVLDPPVHVFFETEEERETFVEVRKHAEGATRVITAIEVLSPSHKTPGAGRDEYVRKQQQVLGSQANLLEIDLLRGARSPLAPATERLAMDTPYDYAIRLHRAESGKAFELWLRTVREILPRTVFVPLDTGDPDVFLNLQEIFDRCYDIGRYALRVDYSVPPDPPLNPTDGAWADGLLRDAGFRQ